jgi:hypothetical protein
MLRAGGIHGRTLIFLVSKQNLNSYWCIWQTKNCQKQIRIEKVTAPQRTQKTQSIEHFKASS